MVSSGSIDNSIKNFKPTLYWISSGNHPHDRINELGIKALRQVLSQRYPNSICLEFDDHYAQAQNNGKLLRINNAKIGIYYALPHGISTLFYINGTVNSSQNFPGLEVIAGNLIDGPFHNTLVKFENHNLLGEYWLLCNVRP
jgi:hypothetical protein